MKNEQGVTLRRVWNAWCARCGWRHDYPTKVDASYGLAGHNVSTHGGAERIGAEQ